MWEYIVIGWIGLVVLVYGHLIFDTWYYYKNLSGKFRKIYRIFTEE